MNQKILKLLRAWGHQDWIAYSLRIHLLRFLCHPEKQQSYPFEIDFFGFKYPGDLSSFVDWNVYFFGAFDKQELFLMRDILLKNKSKDTVFVDIGANIGHHSLFMSKYANQVHAFEPYDKVREKLEEKIAINHITNIECHAVGLGLQVQELEYFAPVGANQATGSFLSSHNPVNNQISYKLKVVKGDDYFKERGIENIDLIKIDVEGFEKEVLLGLQETLDEFRPIIFLEYCKSSQDFWADFANFQVCLPKNYKILKFNPLQMSYHLSDFDLNFLGSYCNILLCPQEIRLYL